MGTAIISGTSAILVVILTKVADWLLDKSKRKDDKADKKADQDNLIREAVIVMLHDRLYQACRYYIHQGQVDESGYDNVKCLYDAYHNLGGNSTGTMLFGQVEKIYLEGIR